MPKKIFLWIVPVLLLLAGIAMAGIAMAGDISRIKVPWAKQTKAGLYVDARGAYAMWQADPENVRILDCRTPEEYIFVGHAPMAVNIPKEFMVHKLKENNQPVMKENPDFITLVSGRFSPDDTILVYCRSGVRSAQSANMLTEAGYKKVYNIIDGFEGDTVRDQESYFNGMRMRNGWKNAGIPWTYKLEPDLVFIGK